MGITESWRTIEDVLKRDAPEVSSTLHSGATVAELDRLESELRVQLPQSFRESWAIHDGQNDPTALFGLFNYARWLSTDEIIENYMMFQDLFADEDPIEWLKPDKIQNRIWAPGWIKFTEENGNGFVLDLCPADTGTRGQVFYRRNSERLQKHCPIHLRVSSVTSRNGLLKGNMKSMTVWSSSNNCGRASAWRATAAQSRVER